jgi:hypothetical protein
VTAAKKLMPAARTALAVAMLAIAGAMWSWMPTKLQSWAPIEVPGTVGQRVAGRDIVVTVSRTYLAREVTTNGQLGFSRFPSKGVWLVMMVSYQPLLQPQLPRFDLRAEGRFFDTNLSGFHSSAQPEIPESGPLAFELPDVPRSATLLVSNQLTESSMAKMDYAPLDSQIAITLPLSGVVPQASLDLSALSAS